MRCPKCAVELFAVALPSFPPGVMCCPECGREWRGASPVAAQQAVAPVGGAGEHEARRVSPFRREGGNDGGRYCEDLFNWF
jgi:hypothetical protein